MRRPGFGADGTGATRAGAGSGSETREGARDREAGSPSHPSSSSSCRGAPEGAGLARGASPRIGSRRPPPGPGSGPDMGRLGGGGGPGGGGPGGGRIAQDGLGSPPSGSGSGSRHGRLGGRGSHQIILQPHPPGLRPPLDGAAQAHEAVRQRPQRNDAPAGLVGSE